jgi:PAS domain S-box-containing protein
MVNKKRIQKLKPRKRIDWLLMLMAISSLFLLWLVVLNSISLFGSINGTGRDLGILPQVSSVLSMILFIGVGWGFWVIINRRQLDLLRLKGSELKYRNIINHAGEAIFLLDDEGVVQEWNKAAEALFAEPRRNVLGGYFRDIELCSSIDIDRVTADAERLNRSLHYEFPLRMRGQQDIGQIWLSISPISLNHHQIKPQKKQTPKQWFVLIARDITSEKHLETKMSETEKLAGIGQFAAGIAHQLNTPLGSILLSAQMLEDSVKQADDIEDIQRIIRQTEQCRTIIQGLLNFARPTGRSREPMSLSEVVNDTIFLMEKTINKSDIEIHSDLCEDSKIYGNRNEMEQVFFNLVANAVDALPDGGDVFVVIRDGDPGELEVIFEDSGPGIPDEYREQIFQPFFTTKDYGKGTGLGLSIVARIIHEHSGRIEICEEKNARFIIALPKYRDNSSNPLGAVEQTELFVEEK